MSATLEAHSDADAEVTDGPPIRYVLARVEGGDAPDDARRFLDYLTGPDAAAVFTRHGFTAVRVHSQPLQIASIVRAVRE